MGELTALPMPFSWINWRASEKGARKRIVEGRGGKKRERGG